MLLLSLELPRLSESGSAKRFSYKLLLVLVLVVIDTADRIVEQLKSQYPRKPNEQQSS